MISCELLPPKFRRYLHLLHRYGADNDYYYYDYGYDDDDYGDHYDYCVHQS